MQAMTQFPAPRNNLGDLKRYFDKLESHIRGLESLGETQEHYETLLVPIVVNNLPPEIRQQPVRENRGTDWNLQSLRRIMKREIEILQAGEVSLTVQPTS